MVWSASAKTLRTLYLNPATEGVYGCSFPECYQSSNFWFQAVHPDDRVLLECHLQLLMEKGNTELEYRIVHPKEGIRWLYRRSQLVQNEIGQAVRIDSIDSDITERKSVA